MSSRWHSQCSRGRFRSKELTMYRSYLRGLGLVILALTIAACAVGGDAPPAGDVSPMESTPVVANPASEATIDAVAGQVVDALAQQDTVTLNQLVDSAMPNRD